MTCICGNAIDEGLEPLSVTCRPCRENPGRHSAALTLATRVEDCPSPGCPLSLELDQETPVLRCPMHGPVEVVA